MTYLVAALATLGCIALGAVLLHAIDQIFPLPDATPPGVTAAHPRSLPPALSAPRGGKDGMHRPSGNLEPRTRGRLIAWSGSVRRAP